MDANNWDQKGMEPSVLGIWWEKKYPILLLLGKYTGAGVINIYAYIFMTIYIWQHPYIKNITSYDPAIITKIQKQNFSIIIHWVIFNITTHEFLSLILNLPESST